jgi:hypothetical protein
LPQRQKQRAVQKGGSLLLKWDFWLKYDKDIKLLRQLKQGFGHLIRNRNSVALRSKGFSI